MRRSDGSRSDLAGDPRSDRRDADASKVIDKFRAFDLDGNGLIDRHELASVLQDTCRFSDREVEQLLSTADVNDDGYLDYNEFVDWLMSAGQNPSGRHLVAAIARLHPQRRFCAEDAGADGNILGQTNAPTIGTNYLFALRKGYGWYSWTTACLDLNRGKDSRGLPSLMDLVFDIHDAGFDSLADKTRCRLLEAEKIDDPTERAGARWSTVAWLYTLEDSDQEGKSIYGELNWYGRTDSTDIDKYARFAVALSDIKYTECYGQYFAFKSPLSVRPVTRQVLFRGLTAPREIIERYSDGKAFYWNHFVSCTKDSLVTRKFNKGSDGLVGFVFTIDVPEYSDKFRLWDLASVSDFKEEAEVLLPPFTKFRCCGNPEEDVDSGIIRISITAIGQALGDPGHLSVRTVIIHPGLWGPFNDVAKKAFHGGRPGWRNYNPYIRDTNPDETMPVGLTQSLALFTQLQDAIGWTREAFSRNMGDMFFNIVILGALAEEFLDYYFSNELDPPCRILVIGTDNADAAQWKAKLSPKYEVEATASLDAACEFVKEKQYSQCKQRWVDASYDGNLLGGSPCRPGGGIQYFWKRYGEMGIVYSDPSTDPASVGEGFQTVDISPVPMYWDELINTCSLHFAPFD